MNKQISFNQYLGKVFLIVTLGVLISGLMGWAWIHIPSLFPIFNFLSNGIGFYLSIIIQLGIVFALRFTIEHRKIALSFLLFIIYAIFVSVIFGMVGLLFSINTIYKAFFTATILFILLAVIGLTTKVDLTKLGNLLFIGLIVLIITSLMNIFLFRSTLLDMIISIVGLIIFLGFTAYDTQKIKVFYNEYKDDAKTLNVLAILSGFELYLDFINLFLYLLEIFGSND